MKIILARLLTFLFLGLSIIHFYWAFGGQGGFESALPTNEQGIQVLTPKTIDSVVVGIVLLLFGIFYIFALNSLRVRYLILIRRIRGWIIRLIFILRAIGDFKYFGFFKQIKQTEFASFDTIFYSPLCLMIGLGFIYKVKIIK